MNATVLLERKDEMARGPMRQDDDEEARVMWTAIRASQDSAARALGEMAVHKAECAGNYQLIMTKLNFLLWLVGGIAGAGGGLAVAWLGSLVIHK